LLARVSFQQYFALWFIPSFPIYPFISLHFPFSSYDLCHGSYRTDINNQVFKKKIIWTKNKRAPHAAELKHLFGWGGYPTVTDFMLKTWRSFVTTGNPSWGSYKFHQYDGFVRHIEIENDGDGQLIARSEARFDFDAHLFFDR
jgi:hypothetical protein